MNNWGSPQLARELAWRLPLLAAVIVLARQFDWLPLRWFYAEASLRFVSALGFDAQRLGIDLIRWGGVNYLYIVPCTYAEIALGAVALGWWRGDSLRANALRAVAIVAVVLAFNLVKGVLVDLLLMGGAPHDAVGIWVNGAAYATIFVWLVDRLDRRLELSPPASNLPASF